MLIYLDLRHSASAIQLQTAFKLYENELHPKLIRLIHKESDLFCQEKPGIPYIGSLFSVEEEKTA